MDEKLQWLVDRVKIQDVFTRYTTSVDRCDWPRLQTVFADKIDRDMSSFTGNPAETIISGQHVAECRATLPGFDSTQHFLLNNEITIDGDQAEALVYLIADHTLIEDGEQKQFIIRGQYKFRFVRSSDDWKICAMKLALMSTQGDQSIFAVAAQRAAEMDDGRLDSPRF